MADIEEIARQAIGCGFKIHKELGPGLLESVYETVLTPVHGKQLLTYLKLAKQPLGCL